MRSLVAARVPERRKPNVPVQSPTPRAARAGQLVRDVRFAQCPTLDTNDLRNHGGALGDAMSTGRIRAVHEAFRDAMFFSDDAEVDGLISGPIWSERGGLAGDPAPPAVAYLCDVLSDAHETLRSQKAAASVLQHLCEELALLGDAAASANAKARATLLAVFADSTRHVALRRCALQSGEDLPASASAADAVIRVLRNRDEPLLVREAAADILCSMPAGHEAIARGAAASALVAVFADASESVDVRRVLADPLARTQAPAAERALFDALTGTHADSVFRWALFAFTSSAAARMGADAIARLRMLALSDTSGATMEERCAAFGKLAYIVDAEGEMLAMCTRVLLDDGAHESLRRIAARGVQNQVGVPGAALPEVAALARIAAEGRQPLALRQDVIDTLRVLASGVAQFSGFMVCVGYESGQEPVRTPSAGARALRSEVIASLSALESDAQGLPALRDKARWALRRLGARP